MDTSDSGPMPTLRERLLVSYATVALCSVVLASGASLALYGRGLERRANGDMATTAARLADLVARAGDVGRSPDPRLMQRLFLEQGGPPGRILVVDGNGRPLASPGLREARFPPLGEGAADRPSVGEAPMPDGSRMLYVSVPLPASLRPPRGPEPLYLVLARPAAEVRGLWRSMVPSVVGVGALALLLASLLALGLSRSITSPLVTMTAASERIAAGDYDVRVAGGGAVEIGRLAAAFNTMAHEVGEAHRRQRDFVANVSHDLRTPLTTVRGFATALLDGTARSEDQRRTAAAAIESSAGRMAELVETLLELTRLEGQRGGMEVAATPVSELLSCVREAHRHAAAARRVMLDVEAPDGLVVHADRLWLGRAIGNVVENAVRYSPPDSTVRVRGAGDGDGAVEIVVSDEGQGIPDDQLPRIFERFYRGDPSRQAGGSGLGLSIAREIVAGHGGEIAIAGQPGGGTRVTICIPGKVERRPSG